ncbi:MAG: sigma-70 family RNA polymerase sigma factor [Fibrobacterota bacterium]|nr:sigma-70 family RNA polymerase sigma factor [Fibrobacterota bacterium]
MGRYFPQTDTVQDVLQEVYLAVHRGLPRFEARSRLSTWIFSLAYHKVCDKLAEKYQEKDRNQIQSDRVTEVESNDLPPDEAFIQSEQIRMIVDASALLSGKYRDVHILRDFEGMSGEETARVLGITKALVRVRLHRARCMIVDGIQKRFPISSKEHRRG